MYQEITLPKGTKNGIEAFWTFQGNNKITFKVLPDSCVDLIVDLCNNRIFISGIMTQSENRNLDKDSNIIGMRIKAEQFPFLSKMPICEITNKVVELSNINTSLQSNITDKVYRSTSLMDKINCLENLILIQQNKYKEIQDDLILRIADEVRKSKGNIKIKELSKSNFISLRQLERRFKKYMGITLKEFSNIIRFRNAKKLIAVRKESSLLEIAFDTGYYDHAHMNNEFKRIAGETPSTFR